jgi:hypothetical protein
MKNTWLIQCRSGSGDIVAWFLVAQNDGAVLDDNPLFDFCLRSGIPGDKWTFQIVARFGEVGLSVASNSPTFSSAAAEVWFLGIPISNV